MRPTNWKKIALLVALLVAVAAVPVWAARRTVTARQSLSSRGTQGDRDSSAAAMSSSGRYVAFVSDARNLVSRDTNKATDVFVRDLRRRSTTRLSVGPAGRQGNGDSYSPAISSSGRFVAFESDASNLVDGDSNGATDVFVRDQRNGTTKRVSVGSDGAQGDGDSAAPAISSSGRYVAFSSAAALVPDDANNSYDIYVRDVIANTTRRVSVGPQGAEGRGDAYAPSVSANGQLVAFYSNQTLVTGDTNRAYDIFVHDLTNGSTTRASVSSAEVQGNHSSFQPALSANGRFVAYDSDATNLVRRDTNRAADVFVRDLKNGTTGRASVGAGVQGNRYSLSAAISSTGRFVAFDSRATNLVKGDTNRSFDVFVRDISRRRTRRLSVSSSGRQGNRDSFSPSLSSDARYVAFESLATNFASRDTNRSDDVFARGPLY